MTQIEPVIGLHPLNDCVLVELKQSSKNFNLKEGKYDTRTEGIVVDIPDLVRAKTIERKGISVEQIKELVGKRVHFEEFKEGARIKRDNKIYSFIKIEDIRGYEDEQTD
jgi:co-chaperonin GroES (HSP10)